MVDLTFRDATLDDLPTLVAMYADDELGAARESPGEPLGDDYLAAFEAIDADPRHRLVVATGDDGSVVATLQLSFLPQLVNGGSERAQLEGVRVRSDLRGSGVGRAMVAWAAAEARARGCGQVQLTSNASRSRAIAFYESLGFVASHVGLKLDLP